LHGIPKLFTAQLPRAELRLDFGNGARGGLPFCNLCAPQCIELRDLTFSQLEAFAHPQSVFHAMGAHRVPHAVPGRASPPALGHRGGGHHDQQGGHTDGS
jgi:hypothetical protein